MFWKLWTKAFEHGEDSRDQLLLTLGAIRCLYWQALGMDLPHVAARIAVWWKVTAPLHRQGALIC